MMMSAMSKPTFQCGPSFFECVQPWLPEGSKYSLHRCDGRLPPAQAVTAVFALGVKDGKMVLIDDEERGWDIPGGHVEPGETLDQALRREVREEAGCEITGAC